MTASESTGTGFLQSLGVVQLGEAYLLADQRDSARGSADRALMLARQRGERGHEAWALRLLGDIGAHDHRSDVKTAEGQYATATALASELEMRPLLAHCHLGLGKLSRRTGKREKAREHLTTATTMYCEMDMRFWLEQAQAEMSVVA